MNGQPQHQQQNNIGFTGDFNQDWNKYQPPQVGFDELQVLPTHKSPVLKSLAQQERAGQEYAENDTYDARYAEIGEPIPEDQMPIAQPLINTFGEENTRLLFARSWQLREKALKQIEAGIRTIDPNEAFSKGLIVVERTVTDKIVGVLNASVSLLIEINALQTNLNGVLTADAHKVGEQILE